MASRSALATRARAAVYVLGGRAMEIVYDDGSLRALLSEGGSSPRRNTRSDATAFGGRPRADVDAIARWTRCVIGGVMQHMRMPVCIRATRRAAATVSDRSNPPGGGDAAATLRKRQGVRCHRPAQRAVCDQERRGLRLEVNPRASAPCRLSVKHTGVPRKACSG